MATDFIPSRVDNVRSKGKILRLYPWLAMVADCSSEVSSQGQ